MLERAHPNRKKKPISMKRSLLFIALTLIAAAVTVSAAPVCPSPYQVVGNNCAFTVTAGWGAAGLGAASVLTFYVPPTASGPVTFQLTALNSSLGSAYAGYLGLLGSTSGQPGTGILTLQNAPPLTVSPGRGQLLVIQQVCFDPTCTAAPPAGAVPNMFSMQGVMLSPVSADLDVTPVPQITVQFLNAANQVTAEEAEKWIHGALPVSYVPGINQGATPAGRTAGNLPYDAFTITNASAVPITGTVSIVDLNGNTIVTASIPSIPRSGAVGYLLIGRSPGDTLGLFSSSTVLPADAAGIFHGTLIFAMNGQNVVLAQEYNGPAALNLLVLH
jgi:hypothetical protein